MRAPFRKFSDLISDRVRSGIEAHRKGRQFLQIVDADGKGVPGAKIHLHQRCHAFGHGANIFMLDEFETQGKNAIFRDAFKEYFNLATVPFYWNTLEPVEGEPRYGADSPRVYRRPAPDLCVDYCEENGIAPKAHCLHYDGFAPEWLKRYPVDTQWKLLRRRFEQCAERYRDRIHGWEVTNESFHPDCVSRMYTDHLFLEKSLAMAERYFPTNELIVNEGGESFDGTFFYTRDRYLMQIERALLKGSRIDTIGLQYHLWTNLENEERYVMDHCDPRKIYAVLDTFWEVFHKPMQITEMTLPCFHPGDAEDEEIQAELLKNLYSIFFSHEAMEAIVYWNLVDGYAFNAEPGDFSAGENQLAGGLMRFDMTPKPALKMLKKLFTEEWHTETDISTDEGGFASFRGFFGDYDMEIEAGGKRTKTMLRLAKGERLKTGEVYRI